MVVFFFFIFVEDSDVLTVAKMDLLKKFYWGIIAVLCVILFGYSLNFGISGFVDILKGIQGGIQNIPILFNKVGTKVASICVWEGNIFSTLAFRKKSNVTNFP